jgi:hypothetical protein
MEDNPDTSRVALKIVFILSLLLVSMDIFEFYFEYMRLKEMSVKFDAWLFEECIKYHALSQMFFTFFATFAGISATFMSMGLLINYEFFSYKVIDTFLYYNYLIFGPYLLAACTLGFMNYEEVLYNCDSRQLTGKKVLNFSTLLALVVCTGMSMVLTFGYSIFYGCRKMINSIRFLPDGNYYLGRVFWKYVLSRNREDATGEIAAQEMQNLNVNRQEPPRRNENNDHDIGSIYSDNSLHERLLNAG